MAQPTEIHKKTRIRKYKTFNFRQKQSMTSQTTEFELQK